MAYDEQETTQLDTPLDSQDDDYAESDIPLNLLEFIEEPNLIDYLPDDDGSGTTDDLINRSTRDTTGNDIESKYLDAKNSMSEWERKYNRAIKLASMQADNDHKTTPFQGASTVMLPFIVESMLDFNARNADTMVYSPEIVQVDVFGQNSEEKEDRANRVSTYMNYQLSESIPMWRRDQDKLLIILPCVGTAFKKGIYDVVENEVRSELVLANELIFDHNCSSFEEAPDHFQERKFTRNELISYIRGPQEWDIDEEEDFDDDDDTYNFIEAHCWYDLDNDGLEEPYTFMYWKDKNRIVSMTTDYEEEDIIITDDEKPEVIKINRQELYTQYQFIPDPQGGPMGLGWGILMGPLFNSINTTARQLIDAGSLHINASNSGLISNAVGNRRGGRSMKGPTRMKMGQLTHIEAGGIGNSLKDNVMQFPFSGPSPTVFQLMEYLVESARQLTASAKQVDVNANQAASMYLAQLSQALKLPNVITMRVYDASKREFKRIGLLNFQHYDDEKYNRILDIKIIKEKMQPPQTPPQGEAPGMPPQVPQEAPPESMSIEFSMKEDFDPKDCDIQTVANPEHGSQMEQTARAESVLALAQTVPGIIDPREAVIDVLKAMRTPDIDRLAPKKDPNAIDPMKQLMIAKLRADEESAERDRNLREQDQILKAQKQQMEAAEMQFQAAMNRVKLNLEDDLLEAEIVDKYASAMKKIAEAGNLSLQESLATMESIKQLIDTDEGGDNTNVKTTIGTNI